MDRVPTIVPIVEGQGEGDAVPALLRRILIERLYRFDIRIGRAKIAKGKPNLINRLDSFLRYAVIDGAHAVVVLVDSDEDCAKDLAAYLVGKTLAASIHVPVAIVCPTSEYETWIIASLAEQYGHRIRERLSIDGRVSAPGNVENVRDAKGWFKRHMPRGRAYKPTQDQATLTHYISLELVHGRSRSFRRLCHAVEELVNAVDQGAHIVTPHVKDRDAR